MTTGSNTLQPFRGLFHASNIYSWHNPRQTITENESTKDPLARILGDEDQLIGVFSK